MVSFQDDVAVVTGGTRGIGRAVAMRLADGGATVIVTYHDDEEAAEQTTEMLAAYPAATRVEPCDVTNFNEVAAVFEMISDRYGSPTVLINNAGTMENGLLVRMTPEQWHNVIETNLSGAFYCTREAARLMLRNRGGRIVNVASVAAQRGWAGQVNYAASKAGLIGLTRAAARELSEKGIRVNAVAPGYTDTDLIENTTSYEDEVEDYTASGRLATPEEIADVIAFLASETASYVNGEVLRVDDGLLS
ncbi:3-oxoacyl-ACP reductase FabG [Haloferax prahovense]|uniref:3-oxoacyl-ACP reductase FabG n=1 Tax=Haloferax TaxID=2251 RepID=UPI0005B1F4A9|nr:3-oxoacyl-ACP reductase FabG [Haloferax sp. ATB1]